MTSLLSHRSLSACKEGIMNKVYFNIYRKGIVKYDVAVNMWRLLLSLQHEKRNLVFSSGHVMLNLLYKNQ